jgi:hypothetical protein
MAARRNTAPQGATAKAAPTTASKPAPDKAAEKVGSA